MSNRDKTLFLRHSSGETHALRGTRLATLLSELKAGRGMPQLMELIEAGYSETFGGIDLSADNLAEPLQAEADGKVVQSTDILQYAFKDDRVIAGMTAVMTADTITVEIQRTSRGWEVQLPDARYPLQRPTLRKLQRFLTLNGWTPDTKRPHCRVFHQLPPPPKPQPLDVLTQAVRAALATYEATGDHRHVRGSIHATGDCIRCRLREVVG